MNTVQKNCPLVSVVAVVLIAACGLSHANMRPECGGDPNKPGACFVELDGNIDSIIFCGDISPDNDNLKDGIFLWVGVQGENDFVRSNPDGTLFVHQSDDEVMQAAYCTWQSFFDGTCGDIDNPGPNAFLGSANLRANGISSAEGAALCPFVLNSSGTVVRLSDGKTIQVTPTLHLVPDPKDPDGECRVQRCEILKRGNRR